MVLKAPDCCQFKYEKMCNDALESKQLTVQLRKWRGTGEQREVTLSEKIK